MSQSKARSESSIRQQGIITKSDSVQQKKGQKAQLWEHGALQPQKKEAHQRPRRKESKIEHSLQKVATK